MESVLRRLGLKKGEGRDTDARRKLQKELFSFSECGTHGLPPKPSSLAYDPQLSLLAVGTRTGAVKIYGRPGVYFSGQHKDDVEVTKICFLPEQARIITLCSDNSLHLWEYNEKPDGSTSLDEVKSFAFENSKLKTVSSWCLTSNAEYLVLGTDGGSVSFFDVATFSATDKVIDQDVIILSAPEDFKNSPGSIEAVLQQPSTLDKFLIGFSRGLIVLWDTTANKADYVYNASQELESMAFSQDGTEFVTSHSDGSYVSWTTSESSHPKDNPTTPYGPFPCKAITSIDWKQGEHDTWTIFAGGMPRANFGDKYTVSVIHGSTHVVFEFTSRIVHFLTMTSNEVAKDPDTLMVLTEDELVAIDLSTEGWPTFRLPYLASIDAHSDVTSILGVNSISETLWNNIVNAGNKQFSHYSTREWPVTGGQLVESLNKLPNGLLTGHADGSVSFWDVSLAGGLNLLYTLNSADIFTQESFNVAAVGSGSTEEEWPPFRKVGVKRSTIDDSRLHVRKLAFCAATDTLLVGGNSGQVTVFKIGGTEGERKVEQYVIDLVAGSESFSWNGPEPLAVKDEPVAVVPGLQPLCVVQTRPATRCTALAHHSSGQLIAVANEHGVGVFDLVRMKTVYVNCVTAASGLKMSRSRSFQRTLRDSFRQLRRHRSESDHKLEQKTAEQQPTEEGEKQEQKTETTDTPVPEKASEPETKQVEIVEETKKEETSEKPSELPESSDKIEKIEEQQKSDVKTEEKIEEKVEIELIPTTDETSKQETVKPETTKQEGETTPPASPTKAKPAVAKELVTVMATVNSLSFADTILLQGHNLCVTLWVGTVAGHVLIFQLTIPDEDKRNEEEVKCVLAKEIHLKHGAPVVATFVIDRNSHPVSGAVKSAENETSAHQTGHRVVVCTQQQVKIFSLPAIKAHNKYKLTQHEVDAHFTEAYFANFVSKSDEAYTEPDLVCLTNHGRAHVLSVPQLRLQLQSDAMFADSALSGLTSFGGVYTHCASELREFSVSARQHVPKYSVPLKEGMRPVPEPETVETAVVEEAGKDAEKDPQTETVETAPTEQAEQPASGDCDKAVDESVVSVNDSMAAGDITADSIKVHVKEESQSTMITEGDISCHKVVETMVHSVKTVGGVTEESKTTTIEEMKKIEGMMSTCTVTSSTTSSSKVEESTMVTSSSSVTAVEG